MQLASQILIAFVALQHIAFGVLEMFFWEKPIGRRIFGTDPSFATKSKTLAANQGLYNYFLSAGLITSFFAPLSIQIWFQFFFLFCVFVAGVYGAATAKFSILYVQALPALISLIVLFLSVRNAL